LFVGVIANQGIATVADFDDQTSLKFVSQCIGHYHLDRPHSSRVGLSSGNADSIASLSPGGRIGLESVGKRWDSSRHGYVEGVISP